MNFLNDNTAFGLADDTVYFRIPKSNYRRGNIQIHDEDESGQNAKLESKLKISEYKVNEQLIENYACTYDVPVPITTVSCDDKGSCTPTVTIEDHSFPGHQRANVRFESWVAQRDTKITTGTGSATISEIPQHKSKTTVLRELTECS